MSALAVIEPQIMVHALASNTRRLSWLASRNPSAEGAWRPTDIEGAVPKDLVGTLYRVAPGQKENHGVMLRHLFDGDAFVCGFSCRDGQVHLRARFVETPERLAELQANRMLYRGSAATRGAPLTPIVTCSARSTLARHSLRWMKGGRE